jgi:hypothetical protein
MPAQRPDYDNPKLIRRRRARVSYHTHGVSSHRNVSSLFKKRNVLGPSAGVVAMWGLGAGTASRIPVLGDQGGRIGQVSLRNPKISHGLQILLTRLDTVDVRPANSATQ